MSAPRRWSGGTLGRTLRGTAARLLALAVRQLAPGERCWGVAMLRELDLVEGDWAALAWALGGAAALFRHFVPRRCTPRSVGKTAAGILSGVGLAGGVVAFSVGGLLRVLPVFFPAWPLEHAAAAGWLSVLVVPETVFAITAISLWPRRRSVAVGIVLAAMTLITHFVVYVTTHGCAGCAGGSL